MRTRAGISYKFQFTLVHGFLSQLHRHRRGQGVEIRSFTTSEMFYVTAKIICDVIAYVIKSKLACFRKHTKFPVLLLILQIIMQKNLTYLLIFSKD